MKAKNLFVSGILGIALAGFIITGCNKNSNSPDTDFNAAQDEASAGTAMTDSKNVSDAAMNGSTSNYSPVKGVHAIYSTHCTVTRNSDSASSFDTLYINFGSTPVKCNDNRYREGELVLYWSKKAGNYIWGAYFDSANVITETFKGYGVGASPATMIGVAGTRTWTNLGKNALGEQNWSFSAAITLNYSNSQTATWTSVRTNTLVLVGSTYYYQITGSAYGTARNGEGYTLSIMSDLYVTALPWWLGGCPFIESGIVAINRTSTTDPLTINFGNLGTCDDQAVATINGTNYTFTMW